MNFSTVMAAAGLLTCIFLAIRMCLSPHLRQQLDARLRRAAWRLRDVGQGLGTYLRSRRFKKSAASQADAAIRRAKTAAKPEGEWDGNVYRPKSFSKDKPRKPH
ncbi:hypothetical protein LNV09_24315 [Paucibacter sp. B2R-40]|uniref:hypothetical protein n=1 Tax=Paucibacter sp. B2R-40 TaxID=2893554 RepID=UPI0021E42B72|nr:hypothetical protein [Paucibacter sp. B2R-40]MCV2357282.1 hypothetical protein [Paucibacter sp. B2R-40]